MNGSSEENIVSDSSIAYLISVFSFLCMPFMLGFVYLFVDVSEQPYILFLFIPILLLFPTLGIGMLILAIYGSKYENHIRLFFLIMWELFVIGAGLSFFLGSTGLDSLMALILFPMIAFIFWIACYPPIKRKLRKESK